MTLSDLERWDTRGSTFSGGLPYYGQTVWPTATKFGMDTQVRHECVPRGRHQHPQNVGFPYLQPNLVWLKRVPRGWPSVPNKFWAPLPAAKIWYGYTGTARACPKGWPQRPPPQKKKWGSPTCSPTFWPTATKFGTVTHAGE